ncbi:putative nuclear RNA export factor SDE5 isoform X3 [Arachis ipaensis]|nr:putative nuclear RNA export factor SDE5 isoform X3 [Arachis ipaensis]XP_020970479.1 putative nuclear RNA export factor SDE5 isoform X3 [Arachis ipaensis]XP_020970480.1 putative nuclear RNA export factor SDE5 isoform X3 [Arachis ipaensis]XP_020970481.1 putative nuclear RNA export factor SDE5 isoform X3 [Arachis ipaensis]
MEVPAQNIVTCDEEKALKCLLDAFGSVFSLEEIASAYCKASRNADLAGEMLYEMKGTSSSSSSHSSNADARVEETSGTSDGYSVENSSHERKNLRAKARSVSVGTVSGTIGRDYVRPVPSANGSHGATKPVKMDVKEMPLTGICREKARPNVSKHNQLQQDMEDFLFKMLGNGFQLDRDMIRGVLESCGYDMQKTRIHNISFPLFYFHSVYNLLNLSMYRLLDPSNVTFDRTAVVGDSASRFTDVKPKSELSSSESKSHNLNHLRSDRTVASNKGVESHQKQKHKDELQKEILFALFKGYQRCEEAPKKTVKDVNNSSRYKHVVFEPPEDTMEEYKIDMDFSLRDATNGTYPDVEDEDYQCVRRAVKEYRATMNEYYKAAVDAFANGDKFKAEKLIDQGNFFLKKAREADEESSRMIVEPKTSEAQEMLLDLHDHGSREAIRLLKCHLSSLAGIPSFEYLKVIIDASNQENTKGSRRRAILKLLEQEAIKWIEGETAGTILIRLDSIDRKKLSFLKT